MQLIDYDIKSQRKRCIIMKNKKATLIGNGFIWMSTSVFAVIFPTGLAYLFEFISQEKLPDIYKYFDSILLIVFSISCSLLAICFDNRTKSLNTIYVDIVKILSFIIAWIFGSYHFYIIGRDAYKINNIFLIITICTAIIFSVFGFSISQHHNLYDDYIKILKDDINNAKNKNNE